MKRLLYTSRWDNFYSFLYNKTMAHANHAHLLSNLPKPIVVPTKLNPTNHSAISFLPETNTINLPVGTYPGEPMLANSNMDDLGQLSKPIGDPFDVKFLVEQADMEDDEEDSDYINDNDQASGSFDGDISLVDETPMALETEALGPM